MPTLPAPALSAKCRCGRPVSAAPGSARCDLCEPLHEALAAFDRVVASGDPTALSRAASMLDDLVADLRVWRSARPARLVRTVKDPVILPDDDDFTRRERDLPVGEIAA